MNETQFWRMVNTLAQQNSDIRIHRLINRPHILDLLLSGMYADVLARIIAHIVDLDDDARYNRNMCSHWLTDGQKTG